MSKLLAIMPHGILVGIKTVFSSRVMQQLTLQKVISIYCYKTVHIIHYVHNCYCHWLEW